MRYFTKAVTHKKRGGPNEATKRSEKKNSARHFGQASLDLHPLGTRLWSV